MPSESPRLYRSRRGLGCFWISRIAYVYGRAELISGQLESPGIKTRNPMFSGLDCMVRAVMNSSTDSNQRYVAHPLNVSSPTLFLFSCRFSSMMGENALGEETKAYNQISLHSITQHTNHELVAIHHPSKTLLEADLMFNLPAKEQFSRSKEPLLFRATGLSKFLHPGNAAHDKAVSGTLTKGA